MGETATVRIDGRVLRLTNLDKVLFPEHGFTKAEVIDYYTRIAPVLLPHLAGRPVTLRRYPDGVDGPCFHERNVPRHAPDWVHVIRAATPGSVRGEEYADSVLVLDLPTLVWMANLTALELHIPHRALDLHSRWHSPDLLVFDLTPGTPATVVECCRVTLLVRTELEHDGMTVYAKTDGATGIQLHAPVGATTPGQTARYAKDVAQRLATRHPGLVVSTTAKTTRRGKVLIDWTPNHPDRTTIAPYSLRARPRPTVSTPVTWTEVQTCRRAGDLVFLAGDVLTRATHSEDLHTGMHERAIALPTQPTNNP
ncbi:non-homologous end-joining DNA ligase [Umezawaea sp. Da 62-37]|uniref:non-homologous end-joining DNA ligase n=1 Tax=Umezawaea sp. Da 62-37 TaxID=3075927 RepID=UPI0028F6D0C9|nr:non-homologous end-joining DNA ligase [Umezawaea sp. Da 62-37]WNV86638.1 non-homologous end-joining DNA ligase [Umezawaea sp. Da 62-37]WNV86779.1 non-homologous end-joining DNA ligase [Umezawaea sp. Da 62-37]